MFRVRTSNKPACGDYVLDAILVSPDGFRLQLGADVETFWAEPASPGDRLRLVHGDDILMADPFTCDLPRQTWSADGVDVSLELTPHSYRCEVRYDGETYVFEWAQRAPSPVAIHHSDASDSSLVDALIDAYHRYDDPDRVAARAAREARAREREELPTADRNRTRELLQAFGAMWSGLGGLATTVRFERGVVDAAAVSARDVIARGAELRGIRSLVVDDIEDVTIIDHLPTVEALDLGSAGIEREDDDEYIRWTESLGPTLVPRLVQSGRVPHLRGLALPALTAKETRALATCDLSRLEVLDLRRTNLHTYEEWAPLANRLPALRVLSIGDVNSARFDVERFFDGLPSLVDFSADASTRALTVLADHPLSLQIERLALSGGSLGNTHLFGCFPRLQVLDLSHTYGILIPDVSLPALRDLRYFASSPLSYLVSTLERLGPQLELLDLRGFNSLAVDFTDEEVTRALDAHVHHLAGLLVRDDGPRALLHLGRERRSAVWDHVTLSER